MRTVLGCVLVVAGCTDSGESPQPTEPIHVTLTTSDVRVVSVPPALDCGNGKTACSTDMQFFTNQLEFENAKITLVVVEHPDTCNLFIFKQDDFALCRTEGLMCQFTTQPGQTLDLAVSCGTFP